MQLRLELIPTWRYVWKRYSVWAAGLLVILGAIQLSAQAFEENSAFAAMTHSPWWLIAKTLIAAAIPLLSIIHQPALQTRAADSPPESEFTEYHFPEAPNHEESLPMSNANIDNVLQSIPGLVLGAEKTFSTPGSGVDKAAAVGGLISAAIGPNDSPNLLRAKQYLDFSVWALKSFYPMFAHMFADPAPVVDTSGGTVAQAFGKPLGAFQANPAIAADGSARA